MHVFRGQHTDEAHLDVLAYAMLSYPMETKSMKISTLISLAIFGVMPAEAQPHAIRTDGHQGPAFRSRPGYSHFIAHNGNDFRPRFHYGSGGVVIFDPLSYGSYYGSAGDDAVNEGQVAIINGETLPYATPTSDPDVVISPYAPHVAIDVAGIPHGAEVQDPASNLVFLNP
jgi:hypothetical protein